MQSNYILPLLAFTALASANLLSAAEPGYAPPASPRITYSFNSDWKFIRQDVPGAQAVTFDDSQWETVSTPHSFNDVESFRVIIDHSAGDRGKYQGLSWYRKHFKLPAGAAGSKVFIEFEGMRQAGDIYFNGKPFGLYENGITGYGVDITSAALFGDQDNVLAVQVDNRTSYKERATDTPFRWNANDFNPDFGGINRRVWLHITGKIYQTLPLYYGLGTTGAYIYCTNYNIAGHSCDVTVESQVHNATADRRVPQANVTLSVAVVDRDGVVRATFQGADADIASGAKTVLSAKGPLTNARFWSPDDPYLYNVYTILTVDGKVVDVNKLTTGFRKTEFKGGAGAGGAYINDKFVYLKGFAQRTSNEWAGVGAGYPDASREQRELHAVDARSAAEGGCRSV
jgi:beta-galactosidase